jgi:hypothetical protein
MKHQLLLVICLILGLAGCYSPSEQGAVMSDEEQEITGWSAAGELIPDGDVSNKIHLQCTFPLGGNYTVQFSILDPNNTAPSPLVNGEVVRAQAEVVWSVNGQAVRRTVDAVNGLSIQGTAESVAVEVTDRSLIGVVPGRELLPYLVTITVAKGSRASVQQPPTYSGDIVRLGPVGGASIPIPNGAISVFITIAPLVLGTVVQANEQLVREKAPGGNTLKAWDPYVFQGWTPLAAGASQISFEQAAAQADDLQYFTTFGIDG